MRYHQYPSNWNGPYKSVSPYASLMGLSDEEKASFKVLVQQTKNATVASAVGVSLLSGLLTYGSYRLFASQPETTLKKVAGGVGAAYFGTMSATNLIGAVVIGNVNVDQVVDAATSMDPKAIQDIFKKKQ